MQTFHIPQVQFLLYIPFLFQCFYAILSYVNIDVYEKLRKHLDVMPVAFPETSSGVEIDILRRFFTETEAEIVLHMNMLPETSDRIRRRFGKDRISQKDIEGILRSLVEKKVINSGTRQKRGKSVRVYGKLPFAVGLYEYQVDRLTRGFEKEAHTYMDEAFMHSFASEHPRQMRTIPINETILPERNVSSYDKIRDLIRSSDGPFVKQNCICRQGRELLGEQCSQTDLKETCLALGNAAEGVLRENRGTLLSREECLEFLEQAETEGLVLQAQNTRKPAFICCCCSCCCAILSRVKKLHNPGSILTAKFRAAIDPNLCIGCGTCIQRCPMDALVIQKNGERAKKAVLHTERCIGCGLCVNSCPVKAINLCALGNAKNPPLNAMAMYIKMFLGRFGPVKGIFLLIKAGLGFRV